VVPSRTNLDRYTSGGKEYQRLAFLTFLFRQTSCPNIISKYKTSPPPPFLAHDTKIPMLAEDWLHRPSCCIPVYCTQRKRCRKMWKIIRTVASYHQILNLLSCSPLRRSSMIPVRGPCWEEQEQVGVRI
jgi:hypothetical protein